jgi:anti-sigma regulatory factor (Ser/Thr protein kinase)
VTLGDETDALPSPVTMSPVVATDLDWLRGEVTRAALLAGFDATQADRFTLAANEIVINAIQYGAPPVRVTITNDGAAVTVEVHDRGQGFSASRIPAAPPPWAQPHGRGLWIARQLCDELSVLGSPGDVTVRLRAVSG